MRLSGVSEQEGTDREFVHASAGNALRVRPECEQERAVCLLYARAFREDTLACVPRTAQQREDTFGAFLTVARKYKGVPRNKYKIESYTSELRNTDRTFPCALLASS